MDFNFTFPKDLNYSNATNYYYFEEGFNSEELRKIEQDVSKLPFSEGTTFGGNNQQTRSSRIKWIPQEDRWHWLYNKLGNMAMEANDILWKFNLYDMPEQIQYTEYLASKDGRYEWHQDIGPDLGSIRKVSITVQLSEPDDYEGGDLELWLGGDYEECKKEGFIKSPRKAGCVFLFPSYMMHRVAPLTKGTRKSFVLWLGGDHYR